MNRLFTGIGQRPNNITINFKKKQCFCGRSSI